MKVDIHYGKGKVFLQIPEANIEEIIRPWQDETEADNAAVVRQAIRGSEADSFQDEVAGKRLCVLVDDGTREEPFDDIFGQLFGVLQKSSLVRFLICTGTHDAETEENNTIKRQIEEAAAKAGIENFEIHTHDWERDSFIKAGRTSRGTEVMFNVKADDAEAFLVVSDVKVHYFAGYSNPMKNFVPGVCSFETAEQNHSLALDGRATFGIHPWHRDESRRNNPLAEDQLEGMRMIVRGRPVYALVAISTSGKIQWSRFGPVDVVSGEAFTIIDERNTHTVRPVVRLIVSPGGLPNDISLYIAQRALELTKNAVTDGGEILFLAACPTGIGEKQTIEDFYNRLTADVDEIIKSIENEYKLFSHKPYKFAQMIRRLRRIWVYSEVSDDLIEAAHLHPTDKPQGVVDNWLAEEPDARITVVDGANKIALYGKT
ncbi:MAG: lactate racemase domain-containing protein [Planctomycetota bacterium]|jgi:nickel-dependent lactate racemase